MFTVTEQDMVEYNETVTKAAAFKGSFDRFTEAQLLTLLGRLHMALLFQGPETRTLDLGVVIRALFVRDRLEDAITARRKATR